MANQTELQGTPGNYDDSSEKNSYSRRTVTKAVVGVIVAGATVVGGRFALERGSGASPEMDIEAVEYVAPQVEALPELSVNGNVQRADLYEGRPDPADIAGATEPELAEVMTIYIKDAPTDQELANKWALNWELATNAACSVADIQLAEEQGFTLARQEGVGKSVKEHYSDYAEENYGVMFDYLAEYSIPQDKESLKSYAAVTAANFGHHIAIDPEVYGASANVTTHITVDAVRPASSDLPVTADRMLEMDATMTFSSGVYKDVIMKGQVVLLANENGDTYDPEVASFVMINED